MPIINEISSGQGIDPNRLLDGMAQNIAYFRERRNQRAAMINAQQQALTNAGLDKSVQATIDENNVIHNNLNKETAERAGISNPNESANAANRMVYDSSADKLLNNDGKGTSITEQDLTKSANEQMNQQAQNMEAQADKRGYNALVDKQAEMLPNVPYQLGDPSLGLPPVPGVTQEPIADKIANALSQRRAAQQQTPGLPPDATPYGATVDPNAQGLENNFASQVLKSQPVPAQPNTAQQAQDLANNQAQQAQQFADSHPSTTTTTNPDGSTSTTTQTPGTKWRGGVAHSEGSGQRQSIRTEFENEYKAGERQVPVAIKKTTTEFDPVLHDEIRQDYTKLMRQANLAGIMGNTTGAQTFASMAKARLEQIAEYEKEMSLRGKKENVEVKDLKVQGSTGKQSIKIGVNEGTNVQVTNSSNALGAVSSTGDNQASKTESGEINLPGGEKLQAKVNAKTGTATFTGSSIQTDKGMQHFRDTMNANGVKETWGKVLRKDGDTITKEVTYIGNGVKVRGEATFKHGPNGDQAVGVYALNGHIPLGLHSQLNNGGTTALQSTSTVTNQAAKSTAEVNNANAQAANATIDNQLKQAKGQAEIMQILNDAVANKAITKEVMAQKMKDMGIITKTGNETQ